MFPNPADNPSCNKNYFVTWSIDVDAPTPEEAAQKVWAEFFGRTEAGPDDSCVFEVSETVDRTHLPPVTIDLSQQDKPKEFIFKVTVEAQNIEQAQQVITERIDYEEDLGFDYTISAQPL